jgi:hypothetical protein
MKTPIPRFDTNAYILSHLTLWLARLTSLVAILPLLLIAIDESGSGPSGPREWLYLALFPFGFTAGYLLGWRWPLFGGCLSLACMATSLVVIDRTFEPGPYIIWAILSVPGLLFIIAGWRLRIWERSLVNSH